MATPTPIKQNEEEPTFHKPKVHLCFRFGPLVDPIFQVYFLLSLAQVVLYAETGAVPALLVELTQDFNLSFTEQGYLGGMVYAGIAVGAPFTSGLVTCFEPRTVLIWSMAINACVTILFGFTPQYYSKMLISIRFFIGLTQATLSCYCPVWVGRFATKGNQGKWFALLQITIPLGILFGYFLGWVVLKMVGADGTECFGGAFACWRLPFIFQGVIQIPLCVAFVSIAHDQLDIGHVAAVNVRDQKTTTCHFIRQYCSDLKTIVTQFYFSSVVLVITGMYFVLVTIQYWATAWMIVGRGYPENDTMGWYIFVSLTGPVMGAIFGGWLIDKLGGYVGSMEQRRKATGVLWFIVALATIFAISIMYWKEGGLAWVVVCLWMVLVCGASTIPVLTGMYIAAIPTARLKILGSSLMMVTVSLFAYFLCPVITGYLMAQFNAHMPECEAYGPGKCPAALERGFRWSLYMTPISLGFLLIVWVGGCFLKGDRLMDTEGTEGKSRPTRLISAFSEGEEGELIESNYNDMEGIRIIEEAEAAEKRKLAEIQMTKSISNERLIAKTKI